MKGRLILSITFIFLFCTYAIADFQKGLDAVHSKDFATAIKEWKPLAEQGHVESQHRLGLIYGFGMGVPLNYKTAFKWFKLAANQGHAGAQYELGYLYEIGAGVYKKDYQAALKWYSLSAEQNYAQAQGQLGRMYYFGGVG